ncbi:MAG: sugar transferase [Leptolyngbya sp. UWPOB_LEPTO1]|uniref:sugar transferase n=1 Tax=Leptolyngbya sp. UWPOB_LEPTO1 TaxID=2815653 RepID=UPI001AC3C731|nr:sugar transferase [Leptolyngbya sp. UWPOB_LEPTO1]MBN8560356.1 sugar transferase [Leptolyngbya sp. UWPOB_LEPTO1]
MQLRKGTNIRELRVLSLFSLDALAIYLAWYFAQSLSTPWSIFWTTDNPVSFLPILGIELGVLASGGFYQSGESRRNYAGLVRALSIANVLLLLTAYFYQPSQFISRSHFLFFWCFSIVLVVGARFCIDQGLIMLRQRGLIRYSVMLIAEPQELDPARQMISREDRYNLVSILDARSLDVNLRYETFKSIQDKGVAEVFITWSVIKDRLFLCWQFQAAGIVLHVIPVGLEALFQACQFWSIGKLPALSFSPPTITGKDFWIKRSFDICVAGLLLMLLFPLNLLIALLIKLDSPGAILYRQVRIGLHGKTFKVWKFRTMVENAEQFQTRLEAQNEMKDGILFKLKDDPRITRLGSFLRRTSLDELPQLINVLLGEMSLVGPRPLPMRDVEKFSENHFVRHEVLPGITGLWQVSGRSTITNFEEVIRLDLTYIQNWTLLLDLEILLKTLKVIFRRTGAY